MSLILKWFSKIYLRCTTCPLPYLPFYPINTPIICWLMCVHCEFFMEQKTNFFYLISYDYLDKIIIRHTSVLPTDLLVMPLVKASHSSLSTHYQNIVTKILPLLPNICLSVLQFRSQKKFLGLLSLQNHISSG